MMKLLLLRMAVRSTPAFVALLAGTYSSCAQTPADDVAAQVRSQGFDCDQPVTVTQDVKLSRPDSPLWTLRCRNAVYRVRLVPDMAARITKLRK
jgi:hypothetical protein